MYLIYIQGTYYGYISDSNLEDAKKTMLKNVTFVKNDSTLSRFKDKKNYDGWEWKMIKNPTSDKY